jgi:hypothetical protein
MEPQISEDEDDFVGRGINLSQYVKGGVSNMFFILMQ